MDRAMATPFPHIPPIRLYELLHFRDWEAQALVRLLYYLLVVSSVLWGLGKWFDLVQEAKLSRTPPPKNYAGPPMMVKSMGLAIVRGCGRFLFYSTVGTIASRLFCEMLLSLFVLRDAVYSKLQTANDRPLVRREPVATVVESSGCGSCTGYAMGSGYQTVS